MITFLKTAFYLIYLRERTRMRVLSKAFGRLKLTLPWVPPDTKLSKLDTLRLATSYISHLQRVLDEEEGEEKTEMDLNAPVSKMDLVSSLHRKSLRCDQKHSVDHFLKSFDEVIFWTSSVHKNNIFRL